MVDRVEKLLTKPTVEERTIQVMTKPNDKPNNGFLLNIAIVLSKHNHEKQIGHWSLLLSFGEFPADLLCLVLVQLNEPMSQSVTGKGPSCRMDQLGRIDPSIFLYERTNILYSDCLYTCTCIYV